VTPLFFKVGPKGLFNVSSITLLVAVVVLLLLSLLLSFKEQE